MTTRTNLDLVWRRLYTQRVAGVPFVQPDAMVGLVAGPTDERREVVIEVRPIAPLGPVEEQAFTEVANRYGEYIGVPARWEYVVDE
jgi:hypothetical protein